MVQQERERERVNEKECGDSELEKDIGTVIESEEIQ